MHEIVKDITREVMDTAGIHDTDAEVEVVLDDQGGWRLHVSWPGAGGEWFDVFMAQIAPMENFVPNPTYELYSLLYEAADKLAREHGDAWYRQGVQYEQSRQRLIAQGALEGVD